MRRMRMHVQADYDARADFYRIARNHPVLKDLRRVDDETFEVSEELAGEVREIAANLGLRLHDA